jgi:nucleotide-binding universal stress UspA family protein
MIRPAPVAPVVVEVDGSADVLRVVDYAIREAELAGTGLVLVRAYRGYGPVPRDTTWSRDQAERELRSALAHVRRQIGFRIPVSTVSREGVRHEVLAQLSRTARVLVVPRRRARGPQRLVAAHGDMVLANATWCPLVVIPRTWKPATAPAAVAVGIDGTELSWEAVGHAFSAASRLAAKLIVVHAATPPAWDDGPDWASAAGLTIAETLAGWQEQYPEVRVERVLSSQPATLALTRCSIHAGLLVLGIHPGRDRLVTDPVAREALAAATSPVVLVRHTVTAVELAGHAHAASRP